MPTDTTALRNRFAEVLGEDVSEFIHPNEFGGYDVDYGRLAEIAHEFYTDELAERDKTMAQLRRRSDHQYADRLYLLWLHAEAIHQRDVARAYTIHLVLAASGSWPGWGDDAKNAVSLAATLIRLSVRGLHGELDGLGNVLDTIRTAAELLRECKETPPTLNSTPDNARKRASGGTP